MFFDQSIWLEGIVLQNDLESRQLLLEKKIFNVFPIAIADKTSGCFLWNNIGIDPLIKEETMLMDYARRTKGDHNYSPWALGYRNYHPTCNIMYNYWIDFKSLWQMEKLLNFIFFDTIISKNVYCIGIRMYLHIGKS